MNSVKECDAIVSRHGFCILFVLASVGPGVVETVEKPCDQISLRGEKKSGFTIRSTIKDLGPGHTKMTPEKGIKDGKGSFSTVSLGQKQVVASIAFIATFDLRLEP